MGAHAWVPLYDWQSKAQQELERYSYDRGEKFETKFSSYYIQNRARRIMGPYAIIIPQQRGMLHAVSEFRTIYMKIHRDDAYL